jgi:hypothetical protein
MGIILAYSIGPSLNWLNLLISWDPLEIIFCNLTKFSITKTT